MYLSRIKVKRDALTEASTEVPEYELPILRLLHGEDMVTEVSQRYWPPAVDAAGNPVPFDFDKAWDTLLMKYSAASKEDRGHMTGHPTLQAYGDKRNFARLVKPTLHLGRPKAASVARKPAGKKRSHHKKPAPVAIAPPVQIEA